MIIRLLKQGEEGPAREFLRPFGVDGDGFFRDAVVAAAEEGGGFLALGSMRAVEADRYDLVGVFVRSDLAGQGLERQMVLTLELTAEKRKARWFGVWLRSDACDDFSYQDINERMRFVERGYVFRAYRADHAGPGRHEDRLDRELTDVLGEMNSRWGRKNIISPN